MSPPDGDALWSEEDGFYYDVMRLPDGSTQQLRVRSLVGLLPMCAATVLEPGSLERVPGPAGEVGGVRRGVQGLDPGADAAARAGRRRDSG